MEARLFRQKATQAFFNPEARGTILTIAPPTAIVLLGTLTPIFVVLGVLLGVSRVRVYAQGRGIVRPNESAITLRAPSSGTVLSVERVEGRRGLRGDVLLTLDGRQAEDARSKCVQQLAVETDNLGSLEQRVDRWSNGASPEKEAALAIALIAHVRAQRDKVTALTQRCQEQQLAIERSRLLFPVDAVVDEVTVGAGSQVREGDVLATIVPATAQLVAYVAVPETYRSEVSAGRAVRLTFDAFPVDEIGPGSGVVARVLDGLPSGVKIEAPNEWSTFAEVSIAEMPRGAGALRSGMTLTADILAREQRLLEVLFGASVE